jgi:hypothetical protein
MRKLLTSPAVHFKGTGWAKKERATSRAKPRSGGDDAGKEAPEKGAGSSSEGDGDGASKEASKPGSAAESGASTSVGEA